MTITSYEPTMTMSEARARYFAVNDFGDDGGYNDAWAEFELGPIPFPFPNTAGRIRAVKVHDLHHIVTQYDTSTIGEFEISAWEIGGGCKDFVAAWFLNLSGLAGGVLSAPRRTFRAFVRGRRSRTFYGQNVESLLNLTVEEARREAGVEAPATSQASPTDTALFAAAATAGFACGAIFIGVGVALLPLGLATQYLRKRSTKSHAEPAPQTT